MSEEYVFIPAERGDRTTSVVSCPENYDPAARPAVILAHGAENDMFHPLLVHMSHVLELAGYLCVRFNFRYRDKGRKKPDSDDVLIETWRRVFYYYKEHPAYSPAKVVLVGKSMGGRIASLAVAAEIMDPDGLIFLGYPLHSPGKKDVIRDAHLHKITLPMLFFTGSRDPFCDNAVLKDALGRIKAPWTLELIEDADHSFKMPAHSDMTEEQVYARILGKTLHWLEKI
jgi:predicted alpha/beta-hydrolase family hydrolase